MQELRDSIVISFADSGGMQSVVLTCVGDSPLPSHRTADDMPAIADARGAGELGQSEEELMALRAANRYSGNIAERLADVEAMSGELATTSPPSWLHPGLHTYPGLHPLSDHASEEIHKILATVGEAYRGDDLYELHEVRAAKINFEIENRALERVEDASVKVSVDSRNGRLLVVEKPPQKPETSSVPVSPPDLSNLEYPRVEMEAGNYVVTEAIGDLTRGVSAKAFRTSLRMVLSNQLAGTRIPFTVEVLGRNLSQPVVSVLYADVTVPDVPGRSVN